MATLNEPSPQGTGSGAKIPYWGMQKLKTSLRSAYKQSMTTLQKLTLLEVLDLETTKTAQAKEIASLKKRVKKLERKRKSKTRDEFIQDGFDADMDEVFKDVEGDAEQVISTVADEVSTGDAVNSATGTEVNTASAPVTTAGVSVSTAEPITTASVNITTAEPITPPTTTTTVFEDEDLTIAQTLVKMRSEKSKVRGVVMQEPSETATRPTVPPQQHDPKDKGKGKMVEQEKPLKKKDQIKFDEEIAQRLQAQMQAELEEEERLAREREEDANIAEWDNAQAMMDADYELAARIHAQEQEELTIKEKSKIFVELMDKRKKHFKAFDKTMSWIDSFVPMDSEVVKGSKDRAEGNDGDDVTIDATPLSVKIPIVDYKIYQERKKSFFQIIRADGKNQMYLTFSKMLKNFDREDLEVLWRIVKARFKKTKPVDYMDTFLLLTLKTMFEHHVEDESIMFYLLVEKMYPLTKHTLHQMFNNVKLQVDYECEMAFDLLRLVKKQLKEGYIPE
ncbi:hypothetical protein Tco_0921479 [Tanacetum coccineum]